MNNSFEEEDNCDYSQKESAFFNEEVEEIKNGFESAQITEQTTKLYALKVFNKDAKGRQFGLNEENTLTKIQ